MIQTLEHNIRIQSCLVTITVHHSSTITASPITRTHTSHRPSEGATRLMKQANNSFPSYIDFHGVHWSILSKRPTQLRNHSINTHRHTLTYTHTDTHIQRHITYPSMTGEHLQAPARDQAPHLQSVVTWPTDHAPVAQHRHRRHPLSSHIYLFIHLYIHMISIHNSCMWHMQALYIYKYILTQ